MFLQVLYKNNVTHVSKDFFLVNCICDVIFFLLLFGGGYFNPVIFGSLSAKVRGNCFPELDG